MRAHGWRAQHGTALAAQRLGQGDGGDHVRLAGEPDVRERPPTAGADDAEAVRLVHDQQRSMGPGDRMQRGQRCQVAVGGEHRVGDHDGVLPRPLGQRAVDRFDVGMRDDEHPRP